MDYLHNLLVGPANKLKTTGIILGSVCVGIVGIVSGAFIFYVIITYHTYIARYSPMKLIYNLAKS